MGNKVSARIAERAEERQENREDRRSERSRRRDERRERMREGWQNFTGGIRDAAGSVFQAGENVVDTLWYGANDEIRAAEQQRIQQQEDQTKQMIFDYALYAGVAVVGLVGLYIVVKA